MTKIALLTAYTEKNEWTESHICDYAEVSSKNHLEYSTKHGYSYICETFPEEEYVGFHPTWIKILSLKKHLNKFDYIAWIDADCVIVNQNKKLESFIDINTSSVIIPKAEVDESIGRPWTRVTTGFFILKNDKFSANLLENLLTKYKGFRKSPWHEQSAIDNYLHELGYYQGIECLEDCTNDDLIEPISSGPVTFLPSRYHTCYSKQLYPFLFHAGGDSPTKKSRIEEVLRSLNNTTKFGIYTSFYNCEKYVDSIFKNIENLNYNNFEWHIVDDFSTDNTLSKIEDKIVNSPIRDRIKLYTQSSKKQMYWFPNEFFDESFEWILLVDCDDFLDVETLKIIDGIVRSRDNSETALITTDFHKIYEDTNKLHSISYIENKEKTSDKLSRYHPECDYLNNISYSCFGHCRIFKNLPNLKFEINDQLACAEDSYRVFWMSSLGKHLHIPRALYKWTLRENSESHSSSLPSNFNNNFDIALNRLRNSDKGVDSRYASIYIETCSIQSVPFETLQSIKSINLISKQLTQEEKDLLREIYPEKKLSFSSNGEEVNVVCLNFVDEQELKNIFNNFRENEKLLLYYQSNYNHSSMANLESHIDKKIQSIGKVLLENGYGYTWWRYIRHFVVYVNL